VDFLTDTTKQLGDTPYCWLQPVAKKAKRDAFEVSILDTGHYPRIQGSTFLPKDSTTLKHMQAAMEAVAAQLDAHQTRLLEHEIELRAFDAPSIELKL